MAAVLARVPRQGRLLEVGCGHGLFANAAALGNPGLRVLGVDPAAEKIRWAGATVGTRTNIAFRCCRIEDVQEGDFDAVAILDVLYLVPRMLWRRFLEACLERLRPGGKLLLKEVDTRPRWKFYRCIAQEMLSVRVLGLTQGCALAFAPRSEMMTLLDEVGFRDLVAVDLGAGYMTPHVLFEGRQGRC